MEITPANLQGLTQGFSTLYQQGYQNAEVWYPDVTTEAPSSMTEEQVYAWLAKNPRMREWVGERVIHSLAKHKFAVPNKRFESTVEVDRIKILTDQYGIYKPEILQLGESARQWPQDLALDLVENGHARLCYDGQFYFDTDHPVDLYDATKGVQANRLTSKPLNATNFALARAAMLAFKGEDGKPMGIRGDLLLVPPDLEDIALKTVAARTAANGAENTQFGMAKVRVGHDLTNNGANSPWYLLATNRPIKPFVHQRVRIPTFVSLVKEDDPNVFWKDKFYYGVDSYGNTGYGPWWTALRGEG
jgi:phage major head subunit gpT-like protein